MKTLFISLFFVSSSAFADDLYLSINTVSYHFNRSVQHNLNLNEQNFGLGIEYSNSDRGILIGQYKNSLSINSNYTLISYTPVHVNNFDIGVVAGWITGYPQMDIVPAVGLIASLKLKPVSLNIIATPDIPKFNIFGFIAIQLKFTLK